MKLTKLLTVNDKQYLINTDDVQLSLKSPGRAAFSILSNEKVSGLVKYSAGYDPSNLHLFFTGIVETCFKVDEKQQNIFCRELTSVLNQILPLSLRNVTLKQVLSAITDKTGLQFVVPDQPYADKKAPAFMSVAGGYHAMDSLARVFRIPNMIWQQQGDGKIFVGSWEHSYWANAVLDLPIKFQEKSGVADTAEIPAEPSMRPGIKLTSGNIITSLQLSDVKMKIGWQASPWGNEWTNKSTI